jgi:hypothetical protein
MDVVVTVFALIAPTLFVVVMKVGEQLLILLTIKHLIALCVHALVEEVGLVYLLVLLQHIL